MTAGNPEVGVARWTASPDGTAWLLSPSGEQLIRISSVTGESDTLAVRLPTPIFTREQWAQIVEVWTSEMRNDESFSAFIPPTINALEQIRESLNPVQRMWWIDGNQACRFRHSIAFKDFHTCRSFKFLGKHR